MVLQRMIVLTALALLTPGAVGFVNVRPLSRPAARQGSDVSVVSMGNVIGPSFVRRRLDEAQQKVDMMYSEPASMGTASAPSMSAGASAAPEYYEGVRIGPPPDLPSLLLHNRIIYIGMPLVAAVTELVVAEFLYLNYESKTKEITMYLNTPGTNGPDGRSVGFETEAFAIADTMAYVKPRVSTVCVGQAYGAGAMLLSQGFKGGRFALPHSSIMLHQPRSMARGQASDIAIKAREVLTNRKATCDLLAKACDKTTEEVMADAGRTKYLSPEEAVKYGLIDEVGEEPV